MTDSKKILHYEGEQLTVHYDVKRCIHAAECVRALPSVFDPDRRPWVDPDRAEAQAVREAVVGCPTGALHYDNRSEDPSEAIPSDNSITVGPDGPLYLKGDLSIEIPGGGARETRAALCRCGDSQNKPYCDNTHLERAFSHDGSLGESKLSSPDVEGSRLRISLVANGPLIVSGPMTVAGPGSQDHAGTRAALCRCGASENKPYCDGSHNAIGFRSD